MCYGRALSFAPASARSGARQTAESARRHRGARDGQGVIGASIRRKEDLRFLVGAGRYTDDNRFPRQTFARPPVRRHACAASQVMKTARRGKSDLACSRCSAAPILPRPAWAGCPAAGASPTATAGADGGAAHSAPGPRTLCATSSDSHDGHRREPLRPPAGCAPIEPARSRISAAIWRPTVERRRGSGAQQSGRFRRPEPPRRARWREPDASRALSR